MVTVDSGILLALALIPSLVSSQSIRARRMNPRNYGKGIQQGDRWIPCGDEYCHPNRGKCVDQPNGESECECIDGWEGDGRECMKDRDECVKDDPCPDNATCSNTSPDSHPYPFYKCECNDGFFSTSTDKHGDAVCTDSPPVSNIEEYPKESTLDECYSRCPWQRGDCFENANGNYECVCDDGYTYDNDEDECKDIDECDEDYPCPPKDEGGFCVDYDPDHPEFQKWKCGCRKGYIATGIDEHGATGCKPEFTSSSTVASAPCDNNACCEEETCVNDTDGTGYTCQCNTPTGVCCIVEVTENHQDISGVEEPESEPLPESEPCDGRCNDANQECGPNNICICKDGYFPPAGVGGTCQPQNECADSNRNDCDKNANCIEKDPGYSCECKDGYEGDGFNCQDVDECNDKRLNNCNSDEVCINKGGSYECRKITRPPTKAPTNAPKIAQLAIPESLSPSLSSVPSLVPSKLSSTSPSQRQFSSIGKGAVVVGRPFVDKHGNTHLASADVQDDVFWSADCPSNINVKSANHTAAAMNALGKDWTRRALGEHASIASFAAFTIALMSNQAPPQLISESLAAAEDEYRHAETSFEIASLILGEPVEPQAIPPSSHDFGYNLADLALGTAEEGCIGETLSALKAAQEVDEGIDAYDGITDEMKAFLKDKVKTIVLEESRHAMLAWRTVSWVCQEDKLACNETVQKKLAPENLVLALDSFFPEAETQKARMEGEKIFKLLVPYVVNLETNWAVECNDVDESSRVDTEKSLVEQLANIIVEGVICEG